jgi:hypothetical protein
VAAHALGGAASEGIRDRVTVALNLANPPQVSVVFRPLLGILCLGQKRLVTPGETRHEQIFLVATRCFVDLPNYSLGIRVDTFPILERAELLPG